MKNIGEYIKKYKRSSDKKWFSLIYQEMMPRIYRFYYFRTMDREISEDLVSEVFIRVYRNIGKANLNGRSFMAWTYRIANNLLIDYYRKNSGINTEPLDYQLNQEEMSADEIFKKNSSFFRKEFGIQNSELLRAMGKLTGLQKEAILLRFVEDMDYGTIAGILNKNKGTIRGIIFRAMEKIRKEIG